MRDWPGMHLESSPMAAEGSRWAANVQFWYKGELRRRAALEKLGTNGGTQVLAVEQQGKTQLIALRNGTVSRVDL